MTTTTTTSTKESLSPHLPHIINQQHKTNNKTNNSSKITTNSNSNNIKKPIPPVTHPILLSNNNNSSNRKPIPLVIHATLSSNNDNNNNTNRNNNNNTHNRKLFPPATHPILSPGLSDSVAKAEQNVTCQTLVLGEVVGISDDDRVQLTVTPVRLHTCQTVHQSLTPLNLSIYPYIKKDQAMAQYTSTSQQFH